jgi:hypothetical protein
MSSQLRKSYPRSDCTLGSKHICIYTYICTCPLPLPARPPPPPPRPIAVARVTRSACVFNNPCETPIQVQLLRATPQVPRFTLAITHTLNSQDRASSPTQLPVNCRNSSTTGRSDARISTSPLCNSQSSMLARFLFKTRREF